MKSKTVMIHISSIKKDTLYAEMKTIFKKRHALMTIKFVLMTYFDCNSMYFKHFNQSNVSNFYKDRCTNLIQFLFRLRYLL